MRRDKGAKPLCNLLSVDIELDMEMVVRFAKVEAAEEAILPGFKPSRPANTSDRPPKRRGTGNNTAGFSFTEGGGSHYQKLFFAGTTGNNDEPPLYLLKINLQ